ncbi:methyltransferase [Siphonobacter curvatus]|uniref:Methyltransferase n=1 Tax=Siphonobacter curvatus TaxID=2094562 RepID=A0A2S7IL05_9BACT|nr:methyltransferase [Siphonobacter curvatus]PQA58431.1 methyltransferase [Siphonobacter curvatus]
MQPTLDLAPITRHLRAMYGSRLLVAAVNHLSVFEQFEHGPLSFTELQARLQLSERPAHVLIPSLCAMEVLTQTAEGKLYPSELGQYLSRKIPQNLIGYVGLEKEDPGVLEMVTRLQNDGPLDASEGFSYVMDADAPSPMDEPETARLFTLGLAGRARKLSPIVAEHLPRIEGHLLDVAGGTGFYTFEWLHRNPSATATLFDRPQVLEVAKELLEEFIAHTGDQTIRTRIQFQAGDMLTDALPQTDLLLAASLFHDWPTETCQELAQRFATSLRPGGELWVHDTFLNDTLDGPKPATDYGAALFWGTKGRIYSRQEHRSWFEQAGLQPLPTEIPTQMEYGLMAARKA